VGASLPPLFPFRDAILLYLGSKYIRRGLLLPFSLFFVQTWGTFLPVFFLLFPNYLFDVGAALRQRSVQGCVVFPFFFFPKSDNPLSLSLLGAGTRSAMPDVSCFFPPFFSSYAKERALACPPISSPLPWCRVAKGWSRPKQRRTALSFSFF